uniref:Uncharacterized protein n=1 Tax=Ditylenchus dipsaci TaxID=166011 RepID=A0A915EUK0_9BILA
MGLALLKQGGSLYSLHKSSTRKFLLNKSKSEWLRVCALAEVKAQLRWDLTKTYRHQKMQSVNIDVDLFRFVKA